ncbi:ATP-grasp domain-containing protein [Enterococcus avium]|uniref:ATP-grasp domain-containing protein n=1 Tax=Enterococcus avium TaxID=33945 RepID=UPI00232B8C65|nr:ATP-grasp domain-containing protein [Enterococcus avium]MDB1750812.1 ATP-grasp domain-containing protein [Enterococcus avium]MDB1754868.1 ATP-grasp domain-containing protein [Enterococcus avium]MDB1761954.1 ATP-grasp domain-containing protein [Enterococcus avium]
MSNKKIMILGASLLQVPAIDKAIEMGLQVIVVDMNSEAIGFQKVGIEKEIISTIDAKAVLEVAKKYQIDGIMTLATDMPVRSIALVAKKMGLAGISEKTALQTTNKIAMRKALKKDNVPIPMFFEVSSMGDFFSAVDKIRESGFKCIVKPADNSGSRGVDLITDYDKDNLVNVFNYSKKYSRSGDLIVEEYMEGPEVSVETLSVNNKCHVIQITDKITTGPPYFVEMGHSQPSQLPKDTLDTIKFLAQQANKSVGIDSGPSHTEIKVTKDGPKIVELGARLGGDNITTHLVPLSTGVDMVEKCIQIALGETPIIQKQRDMASIIRYFNTDEGQIKKISGIDNAKSIPGVKQVSVTIQEGTHISAMRSSVDRIGYIIAQASTVVETEKICDKAISNINIEVMK